MSYTYSNGCASMVDIRSASAASVANGNGITTTALPARSSISMVSSANSDTKGRIQVILDTQTACRQALEVAKMLAVISIPVVAALSIGTVGLTKASSTFSESQRAQVSLTGNLDMSKLVGSLQIERGLTATFLASNGTDMVFYQRIQNQRKISDRALADMSIWPPIEFFYFTNTSSGHTVPIQPLYTKADMAANLAWFRGRVDTMAYAMQTIDSPDFYTPFINMLMDWGDSTAIFPPGSKLWTQMLAFSAILRVTEAVGLQRALGSSWFINCHLAPDLFRYFLRLYGTQLTEYDIGRGYCPSCISEFETIYTRTAYLDSNLTLKRSMMLNDSFIEYCHRQEQQFRSVLAQGWFDNTTALINLFVQVRNSVSNSVVSQLKESVNEARMNLIVFSTLFIIVTVLCVSLTMWYASTIRAMGQMILTYAVKLRKKIKALQIEKKRTETLLFQMLPRAVADQLTKGLTVEPETFQCVSIYFSDIVGFTVISSSISPMEVIDLLNNLYSLFDNIIDMYDAFKVETIGDAYMVASGVPIKNGDLHASEIASVALDIRDAMAEFSTAALEKGRVQIRIGIHSGAVVAGIVGTKMPRYCLFGETVNIANCMESTGQPSKVQISERTFSLLENTNQFMLEFRGEVEIQEKKMKTYWLCGKI